jgi:hypothetical protein
MTDFREAIREAGSIGDLPDQIAAFICRFVVVTEHQADAVALWVLHTHAISAADTTPYIQVTSAEPQSGKTQLLEVLRLLVANPWLTGRTSVAALVRKVAKQEPTLLLDESDASFASDKEFSEALRGVLNSGYYRGGVYSLCVPPKWDVRDLPVFCPKAIAGIGSLPDTVESRSIRIELKRKTRREPIERFRRRDAGAEGKMLHAQLADWATSAVVEALTLARPAVPEQLSDRAADVWEPLIAIADSFGGDWPQRSRRAARALSGRTGVDDASPAVRLLADVRRAFVERGVGALSTASLLEVLHGIEESPWAEWSRGKPLSPTGLARLLKPINVRPEQLWIDGENVRGYEDGPAFREAEERYTAAPLPNPDDSAARPARTGSGSGIDGNFNPLGETSPSTSETADLRLNDTGSSGSSSSDEGIGGAEAPEAAAIDARSNGAEQASIELAVAQIERLAAKLDGRGGS